MSKFFGTLYGRAKHSATRCGDRDITAAAQSFDGSVIVRLYYLDDTLMVEIRANSGSKTYGPKVFEGSFELFITQLGGNVNDL